MSTATAVYPQSVTSPYSWHQTGSGVDTALHDPFSLYNGTTSNAVPGFKPSFFKPVPISNRQPKETTVHWAVPRSSGSQLDVRWPAPEDLSHFTHSGLNETSAGQTAYSPVHSIPDSTTASFVSAESSVTDATPQRISHFGNHVDHTASGTNGGWASRLDPEDFMSDHDIKQKFGAPISPSALIAATFRNSTVSDRHTETATRTSVDPRSNDYMPEEEYKTLMSLNETARRTVLSLDEATRRIALSLDARTLAYQFDSPSPDSRASFAFSAAPINTSAPQSDYLTDAEIDMIFGDHSRETSPIGEDGLTDEPIGEDGLTDEERTLVGANWSPGSFATSGYFNFNVSPSDVHLENATTLGTYA